MNTLQDRRIGVASTPSAFASGIANLSGMAGMMRRMLDEVDYGLMLVTPSGGLRYANQLALRSLAGHGWLRLTEGRVGAAKSAEQTLMRAALGEAARGLRRLLSFKSGGQSSSVAVLPMSADDADESGEPLVMLVLGKQPANENLTLEFFARTQKLTAAESTVLHGLCGGLQPKEIARQVGVQISTVRSQIGSIRIKTESTSIRDLINKVAALPPITPAMKAMPIH